MRKPICYLCGETIKSPGSAVAKLVAKGAKRYVHRKCFHLQASINKQNREINRAAAYSRGYKNLQECHEHLFKFWTALINGYDNFGRKEHMQRMIDFVEELRDELISESRSLIRPRDHVELNPRQVY